MNKLPDIRALYAPVQPAVKQTDEGVSYLELLPAPALLNYIYCYWQLKTKVPLQTSFQYRVVADGCMDIFFEANDPQCSFIMGFSNAFTAFPLDQTFNYIGVRFLPGIFPLLFNVSAAELANQSTPLQEVVPALTVFLRTIRAGNDMTAIKTSLDSFFQEQILHIHTAPDSRLYESIVQIMHNGGIVGIENKLNVGISARQLRRLFDFYIGDSPKAFSKVVRFQKLLQSPGNILKDRAYLDLGYFDQAHFIKDFKILYGLTPSQALKK
ncbi:MAG: AraC family transcriptional regulator [Filimonas sp.]|nr:AraC family transcriptional regulator [Filimonas sp.]